MKLAKSGSSAVIVCLLLGGTLQAQSVPALLSTHWAQTSPYCLWLPNPDASQPYTYVTGCVATATAQVMRLHEWPASYAWELMLDSYDYGYTQDQADAVGELMRDVADGLHSRYEVGMTSASMNEVAPTLINCFGYDRGAMLMRRAFFTDSQWEDSIHQELLAGRPVIYGASSQTAGHSFVVHGYDADRGLWAINWGWSGNGDGWFPLSGEGALNPTYRGTGGGTSGSAYDQSQIIVTHVQPDQGGDYVRQVYTNGTNRILYDRQTFSELTLTADDGPLALDYEVTLANWSATSFRFNVGLALIEVNSGETVTALSVMGYGYDPMTGGTYAQTHHLQFNPSIDGHYAVRPVWRLNGEAADQWHLVYTPVADGIPMVHVTGRALPSPINICFSLPQDTLEVGRVLRVTASPYYDGDITCSASPEGLVSISDDGTVTGLCEGTVTLHVEGTATDLFAATQADLTLRVVPYVADDPQLQLALTTLRTGATTHLTWAEGYDGMPSFSSSDPDILNVDPDGTLRAGATPGSATVHASLPATQRYQGCQRDYMVYVVTDAIYLLDVILNEGRPYLSPHHIDVGYHLHNAGSPVTLGASYVWFTAGDWQDYRGNYLTHFSTDGTLWLSYDASNYASQLQSALDQGVTSVSIDIGPECQPETRYQPLALSHYELELVSDDEYERRVARDTERLDAVTVADPASANVAAIYSPAGTLRSHLQPGLNLLRLTDGTFRKVWL